MGKNQYNYTIKSDYNRSKAKKYAEKHAIKPNLIDYPYFKEDDCTNFVSQVLAAGGIKYTGYRWDKLECWFCRTKNEKDLKNISLTWRGARYFRRYWGNEEGLGNDRASKYLSLSVDEVMKNYDAIVKMMDIGDVIQYGDRTNNNIPYHSQIIHSKGYNKEYKKDDLYVAQHSKNRMFVSFIKYINDFKDIKIGRVYLYKIL
ncbi:amidase domain-containing protein [Clostridium sp. DL1XJH146]